MAGHDMLRSISRTFKLPEELFSGMPRIEINGDEEVTVENHKGILMYEDEQIQINGGNAVVQIRGRGLRLCTMTRTILTIRGYITGVEFLR